MNLGRESLHWTPERWNQLDLAIHEEAKRTGVGATLLPLVGPFPDALAVSADEIERDRLAIDEGKTASFVELGASFTLTGSQADASLDSLTPTTLAVRATNLIVLAEDALIFQGDDALRALPDLVEVRRQIGPGLVAAAEQELDVRPTDAGSGRYGERTFEAVADATALLGSVGHAGPYVLALNSALFADTYAPLPGTLATPADRIAPLVSGGFAGTGALPAGTGVVISVGGNAIDLVIGVDPTLAFTQVDGTGALHFRVFERFALRVKDRRAVVRLRFLEGDKEQ